MTRVNELVPGELVILQGRPAPREYEDYTVLSVHKSGEGGHAYADDHFMNRNWHPISLDKDDQFLCTVVSIAFVKMLTTEPDVRAMHDSLGLRCYPNDLIFVPDDQRFAVVRELL